MSVYSRFKRSPEGLRTLVELLETTPKARRLRMIEVGMKEDPEYTERALSYVISFEDILGLPDSELAEVLAKADPRSSATAIYNQSEAVKERFLRNSSNSKALELKSLLTEEPGLISVGAAQLKLVQAARAAERSGFLNTKKIPIAGN